MVHPLRCSTGSDDRQRAHEDPARPKREDSTGRSAGDNRTGRAAGAARVDRPTRAADSAASRSAKASQPRPSCCSPWPRPRRRTVACAPRSRGRRAPACTAPSAPGRAGSCSASGSTSRRPRPAAPRDAEDRGELLGRLDVAVGDRDDHGLDRRQPERERAGEVLDEDPDEPLQRAVDRAVDGDRPLLAGRPRRCTCRSNRSGSITRSIWIVAICHSRPSASSM